MQTIAGGSGGRGDRRTVGSSRYHTILKMRRTTQYVDQEHSTQYQQQGDDQAPHCGAARLRGTWYFRFRILAFYKMQRRAPKEPGDET